MDWSLAKDFGLPGLLILVIGFVTLTLGKLFIASAERVQLERVKVEDKRADATVAALTTLNGKIDANHTANLQGHQEIATGIAEIRGKLDEAIGWQERSDVTAIPQPRRVVTPVQGVPVSAGYYPPQRPKTQGGGR